MKPVKTNAPILDECCPACGGRFTISAASRRKRVQCPHCREVVSLTPPAEMNGTPAPAAAAPDWVARCEMLQARIETLEQQVEALAIAPRARTALIPERRHDFSPVPRDDLLPVDPPESREVFRKAAPEPEAAPCAVLARTFHPSTPAIGLLVAAGDGAGRRLAETLTGILSRAGWKIRGVTENPAPAIGLHGLTLVAAPELPLQRVMSTLHALREAGFAMTFQIDPDRGSDETVLIVADGGRPENGAEPPS